MSTSYTVVLVSLATRAFIKEVSITPILSTNGETEAIKRKSDLTAQYHPASQGQKLE